MIPSLVVTEIRSALVEYLASTFALADEDVRDALSAFLEDEADGIFRGPYLKVRTPFRSVDPGWRSPLDWLPDWFVPHAHQARSFERLASTSAAGPRPTLVTTGTGSGKTECFLYPILDHCARMRSQGQLGVKALILYPMNALASDQAGRLARLIHAEGRLAGITAGLYLGEQGRHTSMGPDHLIDQRNVLRDEPPDILLTNYKMLDFLLLRPEDRNLWAANRPDTLRYVVLDEFHTYDGAQGTDVAMLLRRLGATLGMAEPGAPLGACTPVATSATLGTGAGSLRELREFAGKVFGVDFDETSVIGETRQTPEEACAETNYFLPIPPPGEVASLAELDDVVAAFCTDPEDGDKGIVVADSPALLSERLLKHPLTRAVLAAASDQAQPWPQAVARVVAFAPEWGRALATGGGADVERALAQFLWLLSLARRNPGESNERPLFSVEVQLWIREVSRLLRAVDRTPAFRWRDSAAPDPEAEHVPRPAGAELPAVHCRRCGMSGWLALASESGDTFSVNPSTIYDAATRRSPLIRALLKSHPDDGARQWYSPGQRRLVSQPTDDAVPVLVSLDEDDARAQRCPACGERDTIRFLGLAVASLASVSINTLFGSEHLEGHERKLLAFTDSVQDASHRASFFSGRTHRLNLRALMAGLVRDNRELRLDDLGTALYHSADTARDRFGLVPPDLLRHPLVRTVWSDDPLPAGVELLTRRLEFEADLEFGLRARVGRTLELSWVAAAEVMLADGDHYVGLVVEEIQRLTGERPDVLAVGVYVTGLLERLRLMGGLDHPLLRPYIGSGGRPWFIWGGRPDGLPPFTGDQSQPSFFTTAPRSDTLASVTAPVRNVPTWVVDWAARCLGISPAQAQEVNRFTLHLLAKESDTVVAHPAGGVTVYALNRHHVRLVDVAEGEGGPLPAQVGCGICGHVHVVPPSSLDRWVGYPCLRYRCVGRFAPLTPRGTGYYRRLYRHGGTRRVVTAEHTGLLGRRAREDVEQAFKEGTRPDAPNVLTATPTLEMGIDIGDLSAVMLTSVPRNPASYIQRVGRAGRATGNSLVTTFVSVDPHGLYYLSDPASMLAGEVRPPNCYLDAIETLQRQFIAYLVDRIADQTIDDAPPLPHDAGAMLGRGLGHGSFLGAVVRAAAEPVHRERFLALFGPQLAPASVERLTEFAESGLEPAVKRVVDAWEAHQRDLRNRRERLTRAIDALEAKVNRTEEDDRDLASLRGQRAAVIRLRNDRRNQYSLSALEELGLLPNYTLVDDAVTLAATMWTKADDGDYLTETVEYKRSGRLAIRELAPGNQFYAGGHRHRIDAVEIGSAQEPLTEQWRLCPDCGYGQLEPDEGTLAVCPRCAGPAIADTGARHTMLRLRTVYASESEEGARVFDESDNRQRERYDTVLTVDVDPAEVRQAWRLTDRVFGVELAAQTTLRSINLGLAERTGESVPLAGHPRHVSRFSVCGQCGAVAEARDDRGGERPERLHQGWCRVRSAATAPDPRPLLLYHELVTEAIRILAPVSMFEVDERLASFKGALLLGLRAILGGDPAHLEITRSDAPNRGGVEGRKQFLVLFDNVPGGTGYLARMAEPAQFRRLLESARDVIEHCPCTGEGRTACHRCLMGVVERNEYDLVRRDLAREMIDDLLAAWEPEPVATIGDIDIGQIQESELERRFRVALRDWVASQEPDKDISLTTVPGKRPYNAFELRLELNGDRARYRIDEQEGLTTSPSSIPDYTIRRMDRRGRQVVVYLDGYQFHASAAHGQNHVALDAAKRRAARDDGNLVWNLVWRDVEEFHRAVLNDPPRNPQPLNLLRGGARAIAQHVQHQTGGLYDVDALNQNPMALLLDYLARPDDRHWERVALSAVAGLALEAQTSPVHGAGQLDGVVRAALAGAPLPAPASASEPMVALAGRAVTADDLPISLLLDLRHGTPEDERWTVIAALDDALAGDETIHHKRWQDWLHWANVLQFVGGPTRDVVISATSEATDFPIDDLYLVDSVHLAQPATPAAPATEPTAAIDVSSEPVAVASGLSPEMEEELDLLEDDAVRDLVRMVLERGAPPFVAGYERGGEPLEAAWPDLEVAVLRTGSVEASDGGWDARPVTDWSPEDLMAELERRT